MERISNNTPCRLITLITLILITTTAYAIDYGNINGVPTITQGNMAYTSEQNGIVGIQYKQQEYAKLGFAISATINQTPQQLNSWNTNWNWTLPKNTQQQIIAQGNTGYAGLEWEQTWDFNELEPEPKIQHKITNNTGQTLENGMLYYIFQINEGLVNEIEYIQNGQRKKLNLDQNKTITGDINATIERKIIINKILFNFQDLTTNGFDIEYFYSGNLHQANESLPNRKGFILGVTKGDRTLPNGATITLDPGVGQTETDPFTGTGALSGSWTTGTVGSNCGTGAACDSTRYNNEMRTRLYDGDFENNVGVYAEYLAKDQAIGEMHKYYITFISYSASVETTERYWLGIDRTGQGTGFITLRYLEDGTDGIFINASQEDSTDFYQQAGGTVATIQILRLNNTQKKIWIDYGGGWLINGETFSDSSDTTQFFVESQGISTQSRTVQQLLDDFNVTTGIQTDANFTYSPNPVPDLNENNPTQTIDLNDISTGGYADINGWTWYVDGAQISTDQNTAHTFNNTGDYNVTLIVEDTNGFTSQYSQTIPINDVFARFTFNTSGAYGRFVSDEIPDILPFGPLSGLTYDFNTNAFNAETVSLYYSNLSTLDTNQVYQFKTAEGEFDQNLLIVTADKDFYGIVVTDLAGSKIQDAKVTVSEANPDTNSFLVTNQAYTDTEGQVVIAASNNLIQIEVSKDGYQTETTLESTATATSFSITLHQNNEGLQKMLTIAAWPYPGYFNQTAIARVATTTKQQIRTKYDLAIDGVAQDTNNWENGLQYDTWYFFNLSDLNAQYDLNISIRTDSNAEWTYITTLTWTGQTLTTALDATEAQALTGTDQNELRIVLFFITIILAVAGNLIFKRGLDTLFAFSAIFSTIVLWPFIVIVVFGFAYWSRPIINKYLEN